MSYEEKFLLLKYEIERKFEIALKLYSDDEFSRGYFCACGELVMFGKSLEKGGK